MASIKTIAELFEDLWAKTAPKDAPPIQKQECQRYFIGGFAACFYSTVEIASTLPEAEAEAEMTKRDEELKRYFRTMFNSKALPRDPRHN